MPEFSIRVGTDNPGFDYEKEVATLFAIRYAFDDSVEDFWIAVNSNSVGDTDDVVLCITSTKGQKFALLIQLKHEEPTGDAKHFEESHFTYVIKDGRRIQNKEKFSVDKYSRGYRTFQSNLNNFEEEQPEIIQHLREVTQFSYILYTNKALVKKLSCLKDAACSELKKEDIYLNRLKTSNSAVYKFKSEDFKTLKSFNEDFLQNFYLFSNQTNIKGVVKLIKAEIKKFFGIHKFSRPVDFNDITKKYLEIIKLWTKGCEFQNGIKYNTLSKRDIINILSDILLSNYKFNLEQLRFSCYDCPRCYDCPQKKIWNKLVLHQDISIVHGDRLIRRFLSDYIGSEIKLKTKKQGDYWRTELDKLACNVFLDQITNERIQVVKLCSRNDNNAITLAGVYKFMWFYQNLPLLLEISDQNEYKDILQILKISKYKLKVILITESNQNFTYDKKSKVKHFSSLKDLLPAEQEEILKLTVQFQGRCPVFLSDVTTDKMHPHLRCGDIIHILCDDFNIGNKFSFNYDKEGHIDRSISKILISFEALAKINNEFFLIETKNEEEEIFMTQLASQICEPFSKPHNQIYILDADRIIEKIAELEATQKCYHRLLFHENFLEWRESTENVASISKFQVISEEYPKEFLYDDVFIFLNSLDINKLQIISACSGMGKSALINYISYYATFHVWILPITLNDLVKNKEIKEKLIQFKETEFFEFYASQILSLDPTVQNLELSLMVFEDMVKSKQLLILLDGFDEISISHKNAFSTLVKFFRTEKYSVVITTREHMKSFLEAEFNVLSRSLKSFTSEEQEHFLTYFFISKLCNENVSVRNPDLYAILLDFVEKLLNASYQNLGVRDEHFTEIPLHLELLANYFLKDCQSSLNKERVSLSTNFNLLDLIEKFITDKTAILCEKYGENEGAWAESLVDDQYLFALEYLFEKEYLIELNIGNSLKKYYEVKKSSSQFIQREGILVARPMQDKMYIDFIHRTFAEYLAARWLAENVQNEEFKATITELLKLRFGKAEHFQVLFGMFDRLLVKKCTFHSSILNVRVNDLKSQIVSNPGVWFETDEMNRTAFHILSVYAKNFTMQDLTAILNITPLKDLELNTSDDYGYSVQDYAFLAGSWTFISLLCKLCPKFIQAGYHSLEKYCILKDFLGLMEFQNRWFVLVKTDRINEEFHVNARVIRPVPLIVRVLPHFIRRTYMNKELQYLSKESFVLIEMDYQFNGEETPNSDSHPFGILLEAESALNEAHESGINAFLEVYCGDMESKNVRRETTSDSDLEFPTREGTDNPGLDYEKEIAALLAVRFAFEESVQDFWIATNVDCVGDTDDIVLCLTPKTGEKFVLLLQLKHENPVGVAKNFKDADFMYLMTNERRDKAKERFSLDKYSRGYIKFQNYLNNSEEEQPIFIQYLRTVTKFCYILYTNRGLEEKLNCLVNVSDSIIFNNLNTSKSTYYGFNPEAFQLDENFIRNLYLFPNQINFEGVFNLIKKEIRNLFGSHKFSNVDFDDVTKKYLEIIKLWTKGCEIEKKSKYITLSKRDIINILCDILLEPYKCNIEENKFSYYDCPQKNIWNDVMLLKDISIVHGDDLTFQFLKDYIGCEVKRNTKKQGKYWKTEVARLASNVLSESIPDEETQIMKLCGGTQSGCITMVSIYKLMWFYKNLPLLLEINNEDEFNDIVKILKISEYKLKAIIITSERDLACRKVKQMNHFSSFKDLDSSEKSKILKLTVQFQGRISIPLSEIAKENMFQNLKCADIIYILCNSFNVGNKFEFTCNFYISRNVSQILISCEALAKIENEFFLIEAQNKAECVKFLAEELASFDFKINNESNVCIVESNSNPKKIKSLKMGHDCVHRLIFQEGFLVWKESTGSVTNIAMFQVVPDKYPTKILYDDVSNFLGSVATNKFQIISACPGMGKSVLLNYVSCFATSCVWILPITLRNIAENDEIEEEPSEFFTFYMDELLAEDSSMQNVEFSKMVFKDMVKARKILLLLDGFDEISILYKDKFSNLIRFFQQEKYPVVIATREHMKPFLENKFGILSRNLKPFTLEEQKLFLNNFFKLNINIKNENSNSILLEFVQQLLTASHQNLNDRDEQFTGIPLQLQLLANNFLKECKTSINTKKVCLNKKFDLLDLYEKFIKNKTSILCEKYGASEKQWLKSLENIQYLLALRYLFGEEYTEELNIEEKLEQYHEDEEYKSQLMQKEGILTFKWMENKMRVDFIHRTFAEYLAAQWLTKNLKSSKYKETVASLVYLRFEEPYQCKFLFVIFDRILAKKCTFHLDIINLTVDDIKSKLESNPTMFVRTDETNRTALHMLSLYSNEYAVEDLKAILDTNNLTNRELDILDNLSYSALDYALLSSSWTFANKLCELYPYLRIKNVTESYFYLKNLGSKYKFLFLTVFHNHLCRDVLIGEISEETRIYDYLRELLYNTYLVKELYKYVRNVDTVREYLNNSGIRDSKKNYYYEVRFAVSFGSKENVEHLLESKNIDEKDYCNENSLLKYATMHKRTDIVEILLNKGANVNLVGRDGDTAVHDAARHKCTDILEMLIKSNADLNVENGCSETPLEVAILEKNLNAVKTLMRHKAEIACPMFIMHDIVDFGDTELLLQFLQKDFDINEKTESGMTPLHTALKNCRLDIAQILMNHNYCDFRSDTATESLLHLTAKIGNLELLNIFLKAGLKINKKNVIGVTPLMIALENRHFAFARILISNHADVFAKCEYGDVFSLAISSGNEEILLELIQNGCDVNRRDARGNTPLLTALEEKQLSVVELLLQKDADVNVKNNIGYTTLHYATVNGYKNFVVQLLGHGVDLNKKTMYSDTALLLALKNKFVETAKFLISNQVEVNVINKEKYHSLHYAVLLGNIEILHDLLAAGAKLNVQNGEGFTPLQLAIWNGKHEIANLLLSYHADVTIKANNGNSTLHIAALVGNDDILMKCLEKNVDINELGNFGRTALLCALQRENIETAKLLIQNGADVTIKDAFFDSVLHMVTAIGCDELVFHFISKGVDVNGRNSYGQTPLALALTHFNVSTAQLLYSNGSDINGQETDKFSILHLAASCGYNELVIGCLDKGHDISRPDFLGYLPIEQAVMNNKFDTVKLLIEMGTIPSMLTLILYIGILKVQSDRGVEEMIKYFKLLLEKFNNINLQDKCGNTVLHYLCGSDFIKDPERECNYVEIFQQKVVELLVSLGADFNMKNRDYKSPYSLAFEKKLEVILGIFDQ